MKFKAVTFIVNGDIAHGHYFYDITLSDALLKMKELKIDAVSMLNKNMNISCYYY